MNTSNKIKTEMLQQLGLHKYYNTLSSVSLVQNKLYLLSELVDLDYQFALHKSGPFSNDLIGFIENIYPNYACLCESSHLTDEIIQKIEIINTIREEKLFCMLGQKEAYKLLSSMSYINNNLKLLEDRRSGSNYENFDEFKLNKKEKVYSILDKRENIYSQRTLNVAWELLIKMGLVKEEVCL